MVFVSLKAVGQFRAFSFVGEFTDEQCERLGVTGDPQRSGVNRIEAGVADQFSDSRFTARFVPALDEAGPRAVAPGIENANKHFAGHGVESADNPSLGNPLGEFFRARGTMGDDQLRVAGIHRQ